MLTFEKYVSNRPIETLKEGDFFVTDNREVLYRVEKMEERRKRVPCTIIHQNPGTNPISTFPVGQMVTKVSIKEIKLKETRY